MIVERVASIHVGDDDLRHMGDDDLRHVGDNDLRHSCE